jgi:hypothetical protein
MWFKVVKMAATYQEGQMRFTMAKTHAMKVVAWLICTGYLLISPATALELRTTLDAATGVKLAIPVDLVGEPTTQQWGQNWKSPNQHLSIDTINFGKGTLQERYEKIINKRGRVVSKKYIEEYRLLVEGTDTPEDKNKGGESLFHVEMQARGGEIRGLSIVYSKPASRELAGAVQAIIQSFEAFPKPVIANPDRTDEKKVEERERRIGELNKRVQDRDKQITELTAKVRLLETQPKQSQREEELRSERDSLLKERNTLQTQLVDLAKQIDEAASERRDLLKKVADLQKKVEELANVESVGARVALVIGNDKYPNLSQKSQLTRAVNDSRAVARALRDLGFRVTEGQNLSRQEMSEALINFAKNTNAGDIAFIYFAGHGVAIEGVNYLLPSDLSPANTGQEARVRTMAIAESVIIAEIQRKARVAVIVLDACRDNPLLTGGFRSIGGEKGFATPGVQAEGVFAIYSAGFGQAALDNLGSNDRNCNSVFTRVLVAHLYRSHDTHLGDLMIDVREEVSKEAAKISFAQYPAYYDQTRGGRIFLAARAPPSAPPMGGGSC